jgi:hypothetical protein
LQIDFGVSVSNKVAYPARRAPVFFLRTSTIPDPDILFRLMPVRFEPNFDVFPAIANPPAKLQIGQVAGPSRSLPDR